MSDINSYIILCLIISSMSFLISIGLEKLMEPDTNIFKPFNCDRWITTQFTAYNIVIFTIFLIVLNLGDYINLLLTK